MSEIPSFYGPDARAQLARIFEATGCRTLAALAELLGLRLSAIVEAGKHGRIPADWLIRLSRLGINTYWIVTGLGPVFAEHAPVARENDAEARRRPDAGVVLRDMLRCVPTQDLTEELDRRKGGCRPRRPAG